MSGLKRKLTARQTRFLGMLAESPESAISLRWRNIKEHAQKLSINEIEMTINGLLKRKYVRSDHGSDEVTRSMYLVTDEGRVALVDALQGMGE